MGCTLPLVLTVDAPVTGETRKHRFLCDSADRLSLLNRFVHAPIYAVNLYPMPRTVRKCLGRAGSGSSFLRRCRMWLSTVRVHG